MRYHRVKADVDGELFEKRVPANSVEEAAGWAENHLKTVREATNIGDIKVYAPGSETADVFPT